MEKENIRFDEGNMSLIFGSLKEICCHIIKSLAIILVLIGLAIAIPVLIIADSLSDWINEK